MVPVELQPGQPAVRGPGQEGRQDGDQGHRGVDLEGISQVTLTFYSTRFFDLRQVKLDFTGANSRKPKMF